MVLGLAGFFGRCVFFFGDGGEATKRRRDSTGQRETNERTDDAGRRRILHRTKTKRGERWKTLAFSDHPLPRRFERGWELRVAILHECVRGRGGAETPTVVGFEK